MTHKSRLSTLVVFSAIVALLAGCTSTPAHSDAKSIKGGTLVIAETGDTSEVDPQVSFYDSSWRIQDMVYDSLVAADEKGAIVPSLAKSWTVKGNVYTFALRDGVKFSNGRALTAADVVGSMKRLLSAKLASYWKSQVGPVSSVSALDSHTVQFTLSSPWQPFLAALASVSAAILPMKELNDGSYDPTKDWLGTGPFVVVSHVQDQQWKLKKNPYYWDAANEAVDAVTVKIIPDDSARIASLRDGSVDIAYFNAPDSSTLLAGIPNVKSTVQASSDTYWLILNAVNPKSPFTNADVRRAVASSIDRKGLIGSALAGAGAPTGVAPANIQGSCSPNSLPTYGGGPKAGQRFLADKGIKPPKISLIAPPYGPLYRDIAQYVQQDLTAAGFGVSIETPEIGSYINRVYVDNPGDFEATIDYLGGYLSPTMASLGLMVTDPAYPGLTTFVAPDPKIEKLVLSANASTDKAKRAALVQQLCAQVAGDANIIPLATRSTTIAVRTDQVKAHIPTYDGYDVYLRNLTSYVKLG